VCYNPTGGWLGSRAEEGRDKLRKVAGRGMNLLDPQIAEWDLLALCAIPKWKGNLLN